MRLGRSELFVALWVAAQRENLDVEIGGLDGQRPTVLAVVAAAGLAHDREHIERGTVVRILGVVRVRMPGTEGEIPEISETPPFPFVDLDLFGELRFIVVPFS